MRYYNVSLFMCQVTRSRARPDAGKSIMFDRIKKPLTDNRLRALLSGNRVVGEDMLNQFIRQNGLPPGITGLRLRCGDGEVAMETEGELEGVRFRASGSIRLLGVKVTAAEQVVRLMPLGPLDLRTDNTQASVNLTPGPGLLREIAA